MKRSAAPPRDRFPFKRRLISVAVLSAVSSQAGANPTGPQVVHGQASFATQGSVLTVTNSPNAIVNWQGFSIGTNETTRFVQQSAASAVLNRVVGVDPSVILGTLQSNGKVFLINPSGILFGQGARVDVAGLVASTLNLNDTDFLAGRLNFDSGPLAGSVVNRGAIATPDGGSVFLVGAAVENSGIIHAPGGEVILAAGQSVRLGSTAAPNVLVEIEAPANRAVNLGEIAVGAGKAGIYGGFVDQKGIVSANTATVNAAGKIVFKATRDTTVAAASVTSASGAQGGTVAIESGGTTRIEGTVSATGASGRGGKIQLLGERVGVTARAVIDASGAAGGGKILVGGDYKGANPQVRNAGGTFVGAETQLRADATRAGDGGRIIVWSDEATRAHGRISARGGPQGGGGGFVETSSAGYLDVTRGPDLTAPMGTSGTWLIDPYDILVSNVPAQLVNNSGAPDFTPTGNTSTIGADLIGGQLSAGASVILDTSGAGLQAGNIQVQGSILKTAGGAASLTLRAHNSIYLSGASIESSAGALAVTLNADRDASGAGAVMLNVASIITNGGNLVIGGGPDPLVGFASSAADANFGDLFDGVILASSDVSTGAGDVSIRGRTSAAPGAAGDGVILIGISSLQTTTGNVSVRGDASARAGDVAFAAGVRVSVGSRIASETGTIRLDGLGAGTPGSPATSGTSGVVLERGAVLEVTGAGRIELVGNGGTSSSATAGVAGVTLLDEAQVLAENGGAIAITGSPGSPAPGGAIQNGVSLNSVGSLPGVTVRAGGAGGSITITGLPANGTVLENANGVVLQDAGTLVEATGGATITIDGTGSDTSIVDGAAGTRGLLMFGGARIRSEAGAITITGRAGLTTPTGANASGIALFDAGTAITTVDGAIHITGTGGGTLADPSGQFAHGITMWSGAVVQATGTGTVSVTGTAGVTAGVFDPDYTHYLPGGGIASRSHGVELGSGGKIISNIGDITIVGSGAATVNDALNVLGVLLIESGTAVQSASGDIAITGTGGGTVAGRAGGDTLGVILFNGPSVSTGGAGTIQITGTAGATSGGIGIGVSIFDNSSVTAQDGDITLRGTGSISTNTFLDQGDFANGGVEVGSATGNLASTVKTTGAGSILLEGTAGSAAGGGNRGVAVFESAVVEASGTGSVTLHGVMSSAVLDDEANSFVGNASNGGVWIAAGGTVRTGTDIVTGGGAITITGLGPTDGTGAPATPQIFGVRIAGGSTVESIAGGAIIISGDVRDSRAAGLQGVDVAGSSRVRGNMDNITITGVGGGANRADADGVVIGSGAEVSTSSGNIAVTGSLVGFHNPDGRYLQGVTVVGAAVRTTAGGSIVLDGTGPGTQSDPVRGNSSGIAIVDGAVVETQAGGDITLIGTGGFATDGLISGVYISSDVVFVDNNPDPGGEDGAPVLVSATGAGKVTITGFVGSPGLRNGTQSSGVAIEGLGTPDPGAGAGRDRGATVTTEDGDLAIVGYGPGFVRGATPTIDEALAGAGEVQGVYIADDANVGSKGSGEVRIEGDGGVVRGYRKNSFANPGTNVLGVDATGVTIETSATVFSTSAALDVVARGGYSNNANALFFGFPADTIATESAGAFFGGGNAEFPTAITSLSGDITIAVTGPGTAAAPVASGVAAAFGFGEVIVATGATNTIDILGDGGATSNGRAAAVWFRDGHVTLDAGTVNLLGNTLDPMAATDTGPDPRRMSGVELDNALVDASGVLDVTGVGGSAANGQNYGIWIYNGASVTSTGSTGSVRFTGTGGAGDNSAGINIEGASAVTALGNVTFTATQGDLLVHGGDTPAVVASSLGDVLVSAAGAIQLGMSQFSAAGNVELRTNDLQDDGSTFTTGSAASNYFRLAPWTQGADLSLTELNPGRVFAPRIQFGTPGTANTFGSVFVRDDVSDFEFRPVTRSLEIYANRVDINGQLGPFGAPLTRSIIVEARGDINIGNEATSAGIRVRDADIRLIADADGNGTGNLTVIGGNAGGDFVQVYVEQVAAVTAPVMELRGVDIAFRDTQSVYVDGAGTQTIAAQNDVLLSNSGAGFLSVGGQTLTTLTAGGDLTIESLGDGAANLSGAGANSGAKTVSIAGDVLIRNAAFANSEAQIYSAAGGQIITARSIRIAGADGGSDLGILNGGSAGQTITTTGVGPTGWGIHVVNDGSLDGSGNGAFINSSGSQQITATNGGGMLLDGTGGSIDVWAAGEQTILLDGTGANVLELRGGPGETLIGGNTQTITAGTGANAGAITILGGTALQSSASIFNNNAAAQTVSTTGQLRLVAGSGPDDGQANFLCNLHACANLGQTVAGAAQNITAGSIVIEGGTGGARNEANLFSFGPQTVTAPGGITIIGGAGTGPGNWAALAVAGGNAFAQHVDFGAGGLNIRVSPTGGESSTANVYSDGTQTVTGTGDITIVGGVAGARVWSEIVAQQSQSVTARSISITAEAGPSSTGIFTPNGPQTVATTGGIGGDSANYGLSIRNLGSTGTDQNGFGAAAYITGRVGSQHIEVSGSRGILLEGVDGDAIIDGTGTAQSIVSAGAIDVKAGTGAALIRFRTGASQAIEAGSITLTGGTTDGAAAIVEAFNGTQTLTVTGALTLTAGTAPGPDIPDLANPPPLCGEVSSCAVVRAHAGLQTISAASISMTGGSGGTENLVSLRGDAGQDITIGSGGLVMQGGTGDGLRNFALVESYADDQILRFAAGAPLTLTGGTVGSKHFVAIAALADAVTQQILGNPVITLTGGASGGGDGTGSFITFKGNNAAIYTDPGTVTVQTVHAQSILLQGGGGRDNNAVIDTFGTGAAQTLTVAGEVRLRGGSAQAALAEIVAFGDQAVAAGSIVLEAGGSGGPRNFAAIWMGETGYSQTLDFGSGLTLLAEQAGADGTFAEIHSNGTQTIRGSGDVRLSGGVSGGRSWAGISGVQGQDVTARALSVTAVTGSVSVYLYNDTGTQTIRTTGGEGGDPGAFGLTVRNLGSTGTDQNGFPSGAAITSRSGAQVIEVVDSAGLRVLGVGGLAIINNGQLVEGIVDARGLAQTITVRGGGANALVIEGVTGQATIDAYTTGVQTIVAGLTGQSGSISITGGTASGAYANLAAQGSAQNLATTGSIVLTGGTAEQIAPLNFDQEDCLPACAAIFSAGPQTIDAAAIALRGGASGSENFAAITGDQGQAITVHGADGLLLTGGGTAAGDHSNFAMIDNYGGTQVVTFSTPGAPLTIDAGDAGLRNFAGVYNGGTSTTGQQILGNPVVTVVAGTGGSGTGDPDRFQFSSNYAFIASETGAQVIEATSIAVRGGGSDSATADIVNWGGDLNGSLLGSQAITTLDGLTLEGGLGTNANARVYSHSGSQSVDIGAALTMRRTGAGEVFLGNVFDPAELNLGTDAVEVAAGTLALEGGNLWGDDSVILSLAGGGSATGGSIHAGRASAPTDGGDIVVDPGAAVTLAGSLTLDGAVDIGSGGGGGVLDLSGATLTVANDVTNSGTLRLTPGASPGTLTVAGDLVLTPTSVLDVEIEGPPAGQGDVIDVGGIASLDGTLNVLFPGAYQGAAGDSYRILTAGTVEGTFETVNGPATPRTGVVYRTDEVGLNLGFLNRWVALTGGLWTVANNWSLDEVPTAAHDVEIDVAGSLETITIPTGNTFDINSLLLSDDLLIDTSTLNLAGDLVINPGATLRLFSANVGGAGTVRNSGTILGLPGLASTIARIASSTGQILVQSNTTTLGELFVSNGFTNAGIIRLTGGGINAGFGVTSGTLVNQGTLVSEGASVSSNRLSGTILNTGTIQVDEDLRIDNLGTTLTQGPAGAVNIAPGQLVFLNGGTLELQGALTVAPGGRIRLGGVTVNGPAALLNQGTLMLDSFNTINAALNNQGQIDVPVGSNQLNGALTQSGTLHLLPSALGGAFLNVANGFANDGTIVLDTGSAANQPRLTVSNGTLVNNGTIRSQATGGIGDVEIDAQILNLGTIDVDHSLALISHNGRLFDNAGGALDIATGSVLSVNGGSTRIGSGTLGSSLGTLRLQGTSHVLDLAGNVTLPATGWQLDLSNGLVTIDSGVGGVALTNLATLDLADDRVTANVALNNQGTLRVPGGSEATVQGGFTNAGMIQVEASASGAAVLTASNGLTNSGTVELAADAAGGAAQLALGSGTLTNAPTGLVRSIGSGAAANRIQGNVNSAGSIDVAHDLSVTGALTIPNTATGPVVGGAGDLTIDGAFTVNATGSVVTIGGSGLLATNGVSRVTGGQLQLDTRNWDNSGQLAIEGRVTLQNGAVLTNRPGATLTLGGTNGSPIALGTGTPGAVVNAGTLTKTGAAVQAIRTALDNDGTINVDMGVLELMGSGTHDGTFAVNDAGAELVFAGGTHQLDTADFSGPGRVHINGAEVDIGADSAVANPFTLQMGTLTGAGDLTLTGPFFLSGGTLSGTGLLITTGATVVNNGTALLDGREWSNRGSLSIDGRLNLANGARLTNQSGATLEIPAASRNAVPLDGGGTFVNAGVLNKNVPINQAIPLGVVLTNTGTLNVNSAVLRVDNFAAGTNEGAINIAAGATLSTDGRALTNAGTGRIQGAGILDLGSGVLTNAGTLIPGAAPGTLRAGNLLNLGTLSLLFATIDVPIDNRGTISVGPGSDSRIDSALTQSGAIRLLADATGGGTLRLANALVNTGEIELGAGGGNAGLLYVETGALTNAPGGVLRSTGSGTFYNYVDAAGGVLNQGQITADYDLFIDNPGRVFDTAAGSMDVAAGRTLTVNSGTTRLGSATGFGTRNGTVSLSNTAIDLTGDLTLPEQGWQALPTGSTSVGAALPVRLTNRSTLDLTSDPVSANVTLVNAGALILQSTPVSGTLINQGSVRVAEASTVERLTQTSGSISVDAGKSLQVLDALSWEGGDISGRVSAGNLALTGASGRVLSGVLTAGSALVTGGSLDVLSGGTLSSAGNMNIGTGAQVTVSGGMVSAGALSNSGTLSLNDGTVSAADMSVDTGGELHLLAGALSSSGRLSNAGTVMARGGALTTGSIDNTDSGGIIVDGANVTTGPFTNAGVATLQSGSLTVGAMDNRGILNLNGGTFNREALTAFVNSGTVRVNTGTLSLDADDAGSGQGSYEVGSDATLRFARGIYRLKSLGGAGSSEIDGGMVTATDVSVGTGRQLLLRSGALTTTGALANSGTVLASGGSLNAGSIDNAGGSSLTVNGATVATGTFTNAGEATVQSGSLSVGTVHNSGTLNLNGGTFTRSAGGVFGNSKTVNLSAGTLSLDGGDGGMGGGTYNLGRGAVLQFTGGRYGIGTIEGAGAVLIQGTNADAELHTGSTMKIAAQTLRLQAGAFSAEIDPPELTLDVPGGITLTGGSGSDAYALIQGSTVSITTGTITLTGGAGERSFAGIDATTGGATIIASGDVVMLAGSGSSAGAWMSAAGPLALTAVSCNGCDLLPSNPLESATAGAGLFGNPVNLSLGNTPLQVPSSVIVGVQTAQTGGEGEAVLSKQEQEQEAQDQKELAQKEEEQEEDEEQGGSSGNAPADDEQKNEKPLQVCI